MNADRRVGNTWPVVSGVLAIIAGCIVETGWLLDIQVLKQPIRGSVPMNPTSAACFVALGLALMMHGIGRFRSLVQLLALAVAVVGSVKLVDLLGGWDSGVDRFIFGSRLATTSSVNNNAMAPNAALNFMLAGCAMIMVATENRWRIRSSQVLAFVVILVSSVALLGYAFGALTLYQVRSYFPMALHTALTFLVLALGILSLHPGRGIVGLVTGPDLAAVMVRRLLPTIVALPITMGFIWLWATRAGIIDFVAGISTFVVLIITALLAAVGLIAKQLRATLMQLAAGHQALVAAREAADISNEAKSKFLAAMSHEIRTPMTGVLGMADLLAAEQLDPRQQGYVRAIRTSGQHLLSVINDILDFSRFGSGSGPEFEHVDFSVAELLEQVRSIMAPQAAERGLTLGFDLDEHSPPVVRGDPTRLRQVLINLISNGLKFTSIGGVRMTIRCQGGSTDKVWFQFEVEDTGIGIPEDRRDDLFQAFMQADRSTARKYGGSGLGLAISQQLVTAMGGQIVVRSTLGKGSVFAFRLLLEVGDVVVVSEKSTLDLSRIPCLRILVAEDVEINRDLLHATLTRAGHDVTFAENGEQAVRHAGCQAFDVVLMDVQMPVMDGIEATRRIRAMGSPRSQVPILALTANVMEVERQRCLSAGMNQVLTKPIAWDALFSALATAGARVARMPAASDSPSADPDLGQLLEQAPLDLTRLEGLRKMAGPARLAGFLNNALGSAEHLAAELESVLGNLPEAARIAHRLAGTAPSFGLVRIGALGRVIETRALKGAPIDDLVVLLGDAMAATRCELGQWMALQTVTC